MIPMQEKRTQYNPLSIKERYDEIAGLEDEAEKKANFRLLIPRYFVKKYLAPSDTVLDAAGGAGINAILMTPLCKKITLVDISPQILERARKNIASKGLSDKIRAIEGDITDLEAFQDETFSFIVCVGAALSYALDMRERAIQELLRVAKIGATIIVQVQSKYGIIGSKIRKGLTKEALEIHENKPFTDGMGVRSHLYTVNEINNLLRKHGCQILETATSPVFTHMTIDEIYRKNSEELRALEALEYEYCVKPELLGQGHHLVVVAKKLKP